MNTTDNTIKCFFCERDLTHAQSVNYVSEGPICTLCLINKEKTEKDSDLDKYDQVLLG